MSRSEEQVLLTATERLVTQMEEQVLLVEAPGQEMVMGTAPRNMTRVEFGWFDARTMRATVRQRS